MSNIINYNTDNIRVVRDDDNVNFYSKEKLTVSGENGSLVLKDNGETVESLTFASVKTPKVFNLDELVTAVQGYIDEYIVPITKVPNINDAFITRSGELYTAYRTSQMNFKSTWGISSLRYATDTSGTGAAATETGGEFKLSSGTDANGYSTVLTNQRGQYQAGAMGNMGIGIRIPVMPTGTQFIEWGYTDFTNNGFGFGIDATSPYVFYITGGVQTKIYQSQWNGDKLDSKGKSGLKLDLSEGLISNVLFNWYGYGDVDFIYYPYNGVTGDSTAITAHHLKIFDSISIIDPNQPLAFKVNNGASSTANIDLFIGGHQFSILDGGSDPQERNVPELLTNYTTVGNTNWQPLIAMRKKATHGTSGRTNSVRTSVTGFNMSADGECQVRLTIGGTTSNLEWGTPTGWTDAESASETKVTGGTVLTTSSDGFPVKYDFVSGTKSAAASISNQSQVRLGSDQEAILWIRRISATGTIIIKHADITVTEEW